MLVKLSKKEFLNHAKQLCVLAIPILVTQFCHAGLGIVDAIMSGQVSTLDLAAVSVGSGVWLPIFLLASGICMATTPLVGEALGQNKPEKVAYITQQSLWTAVIIGIIGFSIIRFVPNTFDILGIPTNIQTMSTDYLNYISFGFPVLALYTVLRCYTEALKYPKPVAVISMIGFFANIPFNYIFIYGKFGMPALGGAGCGVASALLMWLTFILLIGYLSYSKYSCIARTRFYKNFSKPNFIHIKKFLVLGLPIGIAVFFEVSLFSLASLVISPLGELAVASHQVAMSICSMLFMLPFSMSLALTIMIASRFGEKNLHALRQVQTTGLICSLVIALLASMFIYIFDYQMSKLFTEDAEAQAVAVGLLVYALGYQVFDAWQVNITGILRGIQDTKAPMYITFFCYWIVALPLGAYLVRHTKVGVDGFWFALVVGLFLASVLLSIRLMQQRNRLYHRFNHS